MCAQTHTYTHERDTERERAREREAESCTQTASEIASERKRVRKREHLMTGIRHETIRKMMDGWVDQGSSCRERKRERKNIH